MWICDNIITLEAMCHDHIMQQPLLTLGKITDENIWKRDNDILNILSLFSLEQRRHNRNLKDFFNIPKCFDKVSELKIFSFVSTWITKEYKFVVIGERSNGERKRIFRVMIWNTLLEREAESMVVFKGTLDIDMKRVYCKILGK